VQGASSIEAEISLTIRCPTHILQKLYQFFPMSRSLATSKSLFMRDRAHGLAEFSKFGA